MKKIITLMLLCLVFGSYSETPTTTPTPIPAVQQSSAVAAPSPDPKPSPAAITARAETFVPPVPCPPYCGSRNENLNFFESFLCLLPIILFLIFLLLMRKKLKDVSLGDALKEHEPTKRTILNPAFNAENLAALEGRPHVQSLVTPTVEVSGEEPKSSSRLIAFLSSCIALLLALCFSTFYIYTFLKTGIAIDLTGLSNILLSLGIGVVPYAFNKVSTALK